MFSNSNSLPVVDYPLVDPSPVLWRSLQPGYSRFTLPRQLQQSKPKTSQDTRKTPPTTSAEQPMAQLCYMLHSERSSPNWLGIRIHHMVWNNFLPCQKMSFTHTFLTKSTSTKFAGLHHHPSGILTTLSNPTNVCSRMPGFSYPIPHLDRKSFCESNQISKYQWQSWPEALCFHVLFPSFKHIPGTPSGNIFKFKTTVISKLYM